jgi:hypothetical protein
LKFLPLTPTIDNGGKLQINGKDLWRSGGPQIIRKDRFACFYLPLLGVEQTGAEKLAG